MEKGGKFLAEITNLKVFKGIFFPLILSNSFLLVMNKSMIFSGHTCALKIPVLTKSAFKLCSIFV